jgi:Zn-dependent peptidase ImmA (M78 family)
MGSRMGREKLEDKAEKTLRDTDTYRVPVAIETVAQRLNLTMEAAALGENVSGILVVKGERGAIGYNSTHARVRQRFTISHEIAHYLLHTKKGGKAQLFIDRHVTFRRDENSSSGVDHDEVEANQLGAALLMPRGLVQQEIQRHDLNLDDEEAISLLAKRFHVSTAAMSNRLVNLRMLR